MDSSLELWFDEFKRKLDELDARMDRRWAEMEQRGAAVEPRIGVLEQSGATQLVVPDNWGGLFDEIPAASYEPVSAPDAASTTALEEIEYLPASNKQLEVVEMDEKVHPCTGSKVLKAVVTQSNADPLLTERSRVAVLDRDSLDHGALSAARPPRLHPLRRASLRPPLLRRPRRAPLLRRPRRAPPRPPRLRRLRRAPRRLPRLRRPRRAPPRRRGRPPRLLVRGRRPRRRARARPRTRPPPGAPRNCLPSFPSIFELDASFSAHANLLDAEGNGDAFFSFFFDFAKQSTTVMHAPAPADAASTTPRALPTRYSTLGRSHDAHVVIITGGKPSVHNFYPILHHYDGRKFWRELSITEVPAFLSYADDPDGPGLNVASRSSFRIRGGAEVVLLFRKLGLNGTEDVAIYHGFQLTDNGVALTCFLCGGALLHFERGVPVAAFLPKLCLFTIPLGDPLCRVHHSPVFLKLIAEAAVNGEDADLERSCVKTVACGLHISKVACLMAPRVSPMHWHRGISRALEVRLEWIRLPGPEYAYDIATEYVSRWFVVTTGKDAEPVIHVSEYKCAKASRGKRVFIVSCGNSGLEVYLDLCGHRILPSMVVRDVEHALPLEIPGRVQGLLDANISTLAKLLVATSNWDSCRTQARHVGQRLTVPLLELVTWQRDVDSTRPARDAGRAQQPQRHVVSDFVNLSVVLLLVPACSMECNAFGLAVDIAQEDPSFLWILLDLAYFVVTVGLESAADVEHLDFLSAWCSASFKQTVCWSLMDGQSRLNKDVSSSFYCTSSPRCTSLFQMMQEGSLCCCRVRGSGGDAGSPTGT